MNNSYEKEIIYIDKSTNITNIPRILSHLEKYKGIMEDRRENKNGQIEFFHLHWPRKKSFFEYGPKILSVRKCTQPTFVYTEKDAYVMMSVNIIKTGRVDLKYLTGLLNSRLFSFWLQNKGKMQGTNFQIDKEPILELPIFVPALDVQSQITSIVDKILIEKTSNPTADIAALERQIDILVYKLYGLAGEQIKVVENE